MKKLIMITLTVVMSLAAMAFPAFASSAAPRDNSDSYISIQATNVVKRSPVRVKDTYSCVYFYPKTATISHVRVRTYGYNGSNGGYYNKTQIKTGQMVASDGRKVPDLQHDSGVRVPAGRRGRDPQRYLEHPRKRILSLEP